MTARILVLMTVFEDLAKVDVDEDSLEGLVCRDVRSDECRLCQWYLPISALGFDLWGLIFGVWGLGFEVWGLGIEVA